MSNHVFIRGLLAGLVVSFTLVGRDAVAGRELAVVVHKGNPAGSLDAAAVKSYFLKQQAEWKDGQKVRPGAQEGELRSGFLAKVLRMSAVDYERYWLERKYASADSPPKKLDDDDAVIRFVGASKGGIGFVSASALDAGAKSKVKVVLTITY